jgi:DNA polymerase (family 10)
VHSHFDLPPARQLKRIMRAMDHPHFTLLAHPGCREIDKRPLLDIDWLRLVRHARQRGCFLELNAQPKRLDLTDVHARLAKEEGVLVAIDSDAHAGHDFGNLDYGIGQARRGWLSAEDVLNTRPLLELRKLLASA